MELQYLYELGKVGKFFIPYEELEIKQEVTAHGQYSHVHECTWRGIEIMIKKPRNYTIQNIHDFLIEVEIWSTLRHPNIAQFLGFSVNEQDIVILMEKIEGVTLTRHLNKWPFINSTKISTQLIKLLYFLHSCHPAVIYRDLKPDNIMIDTNNNVKLIDFGLSRFIEDPEEVYQMTGCTGTLRYMAPEILKHEKYDSRIDIYSLGIVLAYIWTGNKPLEFKDFKEYITNEKDLEYNLFYNKKWSNIINKIISKLELEFFFVLRNRSETASK